MWRDCRPLTMGWMYCASRREVLNNERAEAESKMDEFFWLEVRVGVAE